MRDIETKLYVVIYNDGTNDVANYKEICQLVGYKADVAVNSDIYINYMPHEKPFRIYTIEYYEKHKDEIDKGCHIKI